MKLVSLPIGILLIVLSGCGQSPTTQASPGINSLPDSACMQRSACSGANDAFCETVRIYPKENPQFDFQGMPCAVLSEDWQTSPSCDPSHPDAMCGHGWGAAPTPCCSQIQGPGPKCNSTGCSL